ncbi:hypothetical protein ACCS60_28635 [Rhizobium acaciae]|uniref:hypothetical protein n=1 Tax=Rhizobium acaciae TaxID=2989736 RepID=UPI003F990B36
MRPTTIQITLERHLPADVQLAIRHHILEVAEHMPSHESNVYDAEELSADGIRLWSARNAWTISQIGQAAAMRCTGPISPSPPPITPESNAPSQQIYDRIHHQQSSSSNAKAGRF